MILKFITENPGGRRGCAFTASRAPGVLTATSPPHAPRRGCAIVKVVAKRCVKSNTLSN